MSSDFFKKFEGQIESMGKDGVIGIMKSAHLEVNKIKNNKQKNKGDIRGMLKLHSSFDDWNEMYNDNKNRPKPKKPNLIKSKEIENIKTERLLFINKKLNNKSNNSVIQEIFRSPPPTQKRQILKSENNFRKENYDKPSDSKRNNKVNNNIKIIQSKTISNTRNQNNLVLPRISQHKKKKVQISLRPISQTKVSPTKILLSKSDNDILQKVQKESQYIQEISKKSQQLLITTDFKPNTQRKSSSIPNNHLPSVVTNNTNKLQPIRKQSRNFPNTSPSISQHPTLDIIKEEEYDQDEEEESEYKPYMHNRYNINQINTPINEIERLMQQRLSYQHFLPFGSKFKIKN